MASAPSAAGIIPQTVTQLVTLGPVIVWPQHAVLSATFVSVKLLRRLPGLLAPATSNSQEADFARNMSSCQSISSVQVQTGHPQKMDGPNELSGYQQDLMRGPTFTQGLSCGNSLVPCCTCTAAVIICRILLAVLSCSQQSHTGNTCTHAKATLLQDSALSSLQMASMK